MKIRLHALVFGSKHLMRLHTYKITRHLLKSKKYLCYTLQRLLNYGMEFVHQHFGLYPLITVQGGRFTSDLEMVIASMKVCIDMFYPPQAPPELNSKDAGFQIAMLVPYSGLQ